MKDFELKFMDLQMFNDGDNTTDDSDIVDDTEDTTDTGSESEDNSSEDNFEFGLDDQGNLIIKDLNDTEDDDEDDSDEDSEEDSQKEQPKTEPKDEKFKVKVDGEELEVSLDELLAGYQRQSDYTRKTQALAKEREQLNSVKTQEETPKQEQQQPKDFYENITNVAKGAVTQDLGEDFDEFNPVHMTALTLKINQITSTMQSQIAVQNALSDFEADARAKEPENYDAIYGYAQNYINDVMPYGKRMALEQAFSKGDVKVISTFFEDMRKDYYNSIGKPIVTKSEPKVLPKKAPPVVEKGGSETEAKIKVRDARKLGAKSADEQAAWLVEMGIV
jgi:hypothetical protein